jgi:hypothetical protein
MKAPRSIRQVMTSTWPHKAAVASGVLPRCAQVSQARGTCMHSSTLMHLAPGLNIGAHLHKVADNIHAAIVSCTYERRPFVLRTVLISINALIGLPAASAPPRRTLSVASIFALISTRYLTASMRPILDAKQSGEHRCVQIGRFCKQQPSLYGAPTRKSQHYARTLSSSVASILAPLATSLRNSGTSPVRAASRIPKSNTRLFLAASCSIARVASSFASSVTGSPSCVSRASGTCVISCALRVQSY